MMICSLYFALAGRCISSIHLEQINDKFQRLVEREELRSGIDELRKDLRATGLSTDQCAEIRKKIDALHQKLVVISDLIKLDEEPDGMSAADKKGKLSELEVQYTKLLRWDGAGIGEPIQVSFPSSPEKRDTAQIELEIEKQQLKKSMSLTAPTEDGNISTMRDIQRIEEKLAILKQFKELSDAKEIAEDDGHVKVDKIQNLKDDYARLDGKLGAERHWEPANDVMLRVAPSHQADASRGIHLMYKDVVDSHVGELVSRGRRIEELEERSRQAEIAIESLQSEKNLLEAEKIYGTGFNPEREMKDLQDEDKRLEPNPEDTEEGRVFKERRRAFNVRKMEALKGFKDLTNPSQEWSDQLVEYEKVKGEEKQADREAEAERERQMQKQSAEYLRLEREKMQEQLEEEARKRYSSKLKAEVKNIETRRNEEKKAEIDALEAEKNREELNLEKDKELTEEKKESKKSLIDQKFIADKEVINEKFKKLIIEDTNTYEEKLKEVAREQQRRILVALQMKIKDGAKKSNEKYESTWESEYQRELQPDFDDMLAGANKLRRKTDEWHEELMKRSPIEDIQDPKHQDRDSFDSMLREVKKDPPPPEKRGMRLTENDKHYMALERLADRAVQRTFETGEKVWFFDEKRQQKWFPAKVLSKGSNETYEVQEVDLDAEEGDETSEGEKKEESKSAEAGAYKKTKEAMKQVVEWTKAKFKADTKEVQSGDVIAFENDLMAKLRSFVVDQANGTFSIGPRKKEDRCKEKVTAEYGGVKNDGWLQLCDLERATAVFKTPGDMMKALKILIDSDQSLGKSQTDQPSDDLGFQVVRCKDRLNQPISDGTSVFITAKMMKRPDIVVIGGEYIGETFVSKAGTYDIDGGENVGGTFVPSYRKTSGDKSQTITRRNGCWWMDFDHKSEKEVKEGEETATPAHIFSIKLDSASPAEKPPESGWGTDHIEGIEHRKRGKEDPPELKVVSTNAAKYEIPEYERENSWEYMRLELDQVKEIIRKRMKEKSSNVAPPDSFFENTSLERFIGKTVKARDNHPKTGVGPQFVEAELVKYNKEEQTYDVKFPDIEKVLPKGRFKGDVDLAEVDVGATVAAKRDEKSERHTNCTLVKKISGDETYKVKWDATLKTLERNDIVGDPKTWSKWADAWKKTFDGTKPRMETKKIVEAYSCIPTTSKLNALGATAGLEERKKLLKELEDEKQAYFKSIGKKYCSDWLCKEVYQLEVWHVESVTSANPPLVTLTDGVKHGLKDGDLVFFKNVKELTNDKYPVTVKSDTSFELPNVDKTSEEIHTEDATCSRVAQEEEMKKAEGPDHWIHASFGHCDHEFSILTQDEGQKFVDNDGTPQNLPIYGSLLEKAHIPAIELVDALDGFSILKEFDDGGIFSKSKLNKDKYNDVVLSCMWGGYRDILLNVKYTSSKRAKSKSAVEKTSFVAELQLTLHELKKLKSAAHNIYDMERTITAVQQGAGENNQQTVKKSDEADMEAIMIKQQQILQKSKENEMHAAYISVVEKKQEALEKRWEDAKDWRKAQQKHASDAEKKAREAAGLKVEEPEVDLQQQSKEEQIEAKQQELEAKQEELANIEAAKKTLEEQLAAEKKALQDEKKALQEKENARKAEEAAKNKLDSDLKSTKGKLSTTEKDLASTKKDLASTKSKLQTTEGTLSSTKNDLSSTQTRLRQKEQELKDTQEALVKAQKAACVIL